MNEAPSLTSISTKQERIATLARERPGMALTTLAHHIDIAWVREAYRLTRKDGATGVDRQSAAQYAKNLEGNLQSLLERAKSGTYRAPPVRRVHIPKGSGAETRPLGIPTFEDKVLSRAVTMVFTAVDEHDFLPCSASRRKLKNSNSSTENSFRTPSTLTRFSIDLDDEMAGGSRHPPFALGFILRERIEVIQLERKQQ